MAQTKYDEIHIVNDTIIFRENYKWGLLDKDERILLPPLYDYIESKGNEILVNYDGEGFIVNRDKLPMPYTCLYYLEDYNLIKTFKDGKYGIVDKDFKEIVPQNYSFIEFRCHNIWAGKRIDQHSILLTVYTYDGLIKSNEQYTTLPYPSSIFPAPIVSKNTGDKKKYGIVDDYSNIIIECLYDKIDFIYGSYSRDQNPSLNDQLVLTLNGENFIYHHKKGIEPYTYSNVFHKIKDEKIEEALYGLKNTNNYYFGLREKKVLNSSNKAPIYSTVIDVFQASKKLFSFNPDKIIFTEEINENLFICQSNENHLFSIMTSRGLASPFIYSNVYFHDAYAAFNKGEKPLNLIKAERITNEINEDSVKVDFFTLEGNILLRDISNENINWNKTERIDDFIHLNVGYTIVLDLKEEKAIRLNYKYIEEISSIYFIVSNHSNNEYSKDNFKKSPCFGLINAAGKEILPCHYLYEHITILSYNCICYLEGNTYKYIDGKGNPIHCDIKYYNGDYHMKKLNNGNFLVYDNSRKSYFIADYEKKRISEEYLRISDFNINGIAKVCKGKAKDGLINSEGDIILPCEYNLPYDWVRESNNVISSGRPSLMKIFSKNNEAYINLHGNLVIPPIYSTIELFYQEGFALVCKNGKSGLISLAHPTSTIIECEWDSLVTYSFDKDDFASATGYLPSYPFTTSDQSKESHILLATTSTESCIYDIKLGKVIMTIPFRISSILFRYKSIWGLCQKNKENKDEYILWDKCKVASYEKIAKKKGDFIQVMTNNKWGLYDLKNRLETIPCHFFENYDSTKMNDKFLFFNGYSSIVYHDKKYYLINIHNELISSKYDAIEDFIDGAAIIQQGDKYGLINTKGIELASGYEILQRGYYKPISSSLIICELNDMWGFINSKGEIITLGFERVDAFHEGYAAVKQNGKWGFINEHGKIVIPCRFANVDRFSEGLAAVAFKKRWGYIDKHNNTIIPFRYDDAYPFYQGKADVCISEREGSYDLSISKNGRILEEKFTANESDIDYTEAKRDSWYAMTDGVYGDYSDDFDGDYDFMGH